MMQGPRFRTQDPPSWIQYPGSSTLDPGTGILGPAPQTVELDGDRYKYAHTHAYTLPLALGLGVLWMHAYRFPTCVEVF